MGLGLETAAEPKQVSEAFDRMADAQLIVVDTPGIAPDDQEGRQFLEQMIATMADPEVHLLLSAASQEKTISKMVPLLPTGGRNQAVADTPRLDRTDRPLCQSARPSPV